MLNLALKLAVRYIKMDISVFLVFLRSDILFAIFMMFLRSHLKLHLRCIRTETQKNILYKTSLMLLLFSLIISYLTFILISVVKTEDKVILFAFELIQETSVVY